MRHILRAISLSMLCVTFNFTVNCSSTQPAVLINLDMLARSHVCEQPRDFRAYWWLYGSLPLSLPDEYAASEEPGTLHVFQHKRTWTDYSLTVLLGTLFSITTARIEVRKCTAAGDSSLLNIQKERDAALEERRRVEEAETRAREQESKKAQK